ncbi:MAG: SMC-Scp complex subunit ScpB [Rhodospirillaceae bacterium]|nr:SMC-Scp complex subunit ScpB [Rhodospirillaceae bacterium]
MTSSVTPDTTREAADDTAAPEEEAVAAEELPEVDEVVAEEATTEAELPEPQALHEAAQDAAADLEETLKARRAEDIRVVEALLFATKEPMTEKSIGERLGEGSDVTATLEDLRAQYASRGIHLVQANGRWYFRTDPSLGERLHLEKLVPRKLSRAAIETLAIIAYHQPVTRAEIEEIRGVIVSTGTLDILLEEGWIKPKGHKNVPGRPAMWGTTGAFLDHFGLESIQDLPGLDELKAAGLLDSRRGVTAYSTRAADGDVAPFDTEESDAALEPLATGEGDTETEDSEASS